MRHYAIMAALACVAIVSCKTASHDEDYSVDATFDESANGMTAYIVNYDSGDKIDSVLVADSHARFSGVADSVVLARLLLGDRRAATFVLEPGDITIDSGRVSENTPMNLLLAKFISESDSLDMLYDKAENDSVRKAVSQAYSGLLDDYVNRHSGNPVGYLAFLQAAYEYDFDALSAKLKQYPSYGHYKRVGNLVTAKQREAATAPGNRYVDFSIKGDSVVKLSDYVKPGCYTLVDFWASWCGPCRREMPVIKELYEKYNSRGLNVVGVAVWDKPADSEKAISQLELPWQQILDAQTVPTDLYGISGIPHIMLIDPEGVIVARGMQGDSLRRVVTNAMTAFSSPKTIGEPVATVQD